MSLWPSPLALFLLLFLPFTIVNADPATVPFLDCYSGKNSSQKLTVNDVYAQVLPSEQWGMYLNVTVVGSSPQEILGFTNGSSSLATLFTSTSVLTLNAWSNSSYLCAPLRPPSPLPPVGGPTNMYCPIPAGPFALSSTILWGSHRALTTLNTRIRAVDPSGQELLCVDIPTTPLDPKPNNPYGAATIIFWCTVGLAIAYWVVVGIARIVSAWGRGLTQRGLWSRAQSAGFILASAISGERLATSPALMRFCTPSMRDIIFHTQWCAALGMVAVEWPNFVYPLLSQTAWSTLSYNVTLTEAGRAHHWNPLSTLPYNPPAGFVDQFSDPSSPLYIVPDAPNILFTLPPNTTSGIPAFAYTIGVRPSDLFPICLILFLAIIAATIVISTIIGSIDYLACLIVGAMGGGSGSHTGPSPLARMTGTRSPAGFKDLHDSSASPNLGTEENKSLNPRRDTSGVAIFRPSSRLTLPFSTGHGSNTAGTIITSERGINSHRAWWRVRSDMSSFHGNVLQGNLVRALVLFHLPITIFSVYHMTLPRSHGGSSSGTGLAALSFVFISVLVPAHLVLRVRLTTTNKLYDETRTLLAFGPLYNHYRHGSQMFASLLFATNIVFGVTIGAGQHSGTAQAIVILVVEVASALVTSIWLPWGSGASMGLISFLFCVARIVIAVLLVILTPAISIGSGSGGWVAYGILIILALVYLALFLMLVVKLFEALVRILGGIGFDRSKYPVDSGLLGACGLLGCCGPRKKRRKRGDHGRNHKYRTAEDGASQHTNPASVTGIRTQTPQKRDSDLSSYAQQHGGASTPPRFLGQEPGSRKGSTHSGPPPSVLRPEHALRPYREDSDDENGFIMGAWQPFPRPGYAAVTDGPPTTTPSSMPPHPFQPSQLLPPQKSSGFSRVSGGRAHIDTPYAIATGSTHTFPSVGHPTSVPVTSPVFFDDDDESPPPSFSNVASHVDATGLPPGAMQSAHIRTKSQSAIIEDASTLLTGASTSVPVFTKPGQAPPSIGSGLGNTTDTWNRKTGGAFHTTPSPLDSANDDEEYDSEQQAQPKKKPWYQFGRRRLYSSEGSSPTSVGAGGSPSPSPAEEASDMVNSPEAGAAVPPARSFVVIRKPQSQAAARIGQAAPAGDVRQAHATT